MRSETKEILRTRAVQDIAKARFNFPTAEHPHFKTYVNLPQKTMAVHTFNNRAIYPDIVVVQDPENYVKLLAKVETAETVNEDLALEWKIIAELGSLYLYVPVGYGDRAKRLGSKFDVQLVGIRTWRYVVGYEEIEINDHFTQPAGPEEMAPGPLRGLLKKLVF